MEKQFDIKEWITELEEKHKEHPEDPHVLYNLGNALLGKRDFDEAKKCFLSAVRIDPELARRG